MMSRTLRGKRIRGTIMVDVERQRLEAQRWCALADQNHRRTRPVGNVTIRRVN
jgi:hypothetical protein